MPAGCSNLRCWRPPRTAGMRCTAAIFASPAVHPAGGARDGRGGTARQRHQLTSIEGVRAAPGYAAYAAAKAGVINYTQTAALELAPHGIRVNALAPDITLTEGLAALADSDQTARLAQIVPMGRPGHVDDIAGAAVFLASIWPATSPARPCTSTAAPRRRRAGTTTRTPGTTPTARQPDASAADLRHPCAQARAGPARRGVGRGRPRRRRHPRRGLGGRRTARRTRAPRRAPGGVLGQQRRRGFAGATP